MNTGCTCGYYDISGILGSDKITAISEVKVIFYIHSRSQGDAPHITLNEFETATKLSRNSVIAGLKSAEEHGFIQVTVDLVDRSRIKKYYRVLYENNVQLINGVHNVNIGSQVAPNADKADYAPVNSASQGSQVASLELENSENPVDPNQTLLDSFPLRESDSFNAFNNNIYIKQEKESNTQSVKESNQLSQLESESPQAFVSGQESSEQPKPIESKPKKSRAKSKVAKTDSPAGETSKPKLEVKVVPEKPKLEDYQDYVKIVAKAFDLQPGSMVGKWVNFFTGRITDKKGDYLDYQPEKPLDKFEIAGLYYWYWVHPRFGGRKGLPKQERYLPRTVATIAQRIDEFRADPKYTEYLERAKEGLQRLLDGTPGDTAVFIADNPLKQYYNTPQRDDPAPKSNAVDEALFRQAMSKNAILKPNLAPIGEKAAMNL